MKGIFISCSQALYDEVVTLMDEMGIRGFSAWEETMGRGSHDGDPHLGTHAWSAMNSSIITFIDDDALANRFMDKLKAKDSESGNLGLRAFLWNVERTF
ncbi:MAG: hypothetical protein SOZ00_08270 [Tidjanibacter sp.]|nr:hypothetical protein [Tidjanibacter sp.]